MVLFCYRSLEGDTDMPGGLHARLYHAFFIVSYILNADRPIAADASIS